MIEKRQRGLSSDQRRDLWMRWKVGQSLSEIARALRKPPGSVYSFLAQSGGIAPLPRHRSQRALTLAERETISRQVCAGTSTRGIAFILERAPSTVSREIARNGGRGRYRAALAEKRASRCARRPKTCKLGLQSRLQRVVAAKLQLDWSPEQVSGWLRRTFALDAEMQISHETIYKSLFVQARGVLKRALTDHLRSRRTMRRSRYSSTACLSGCLTTLT